VALLVPWPLVRQAILRRLRANLVLAASLPGDWSEGFAPQTTNYPLGVVSLIPSPSNYDWSGVVHDLYVDVAVFAEDQGDAASIDQLAFTTLQDASLAVTGLTSLSCRRISNFSLQDVDQEGKAIYEPGGTYEVRVSQSNPTLSTLIVTLDSTIA
jgi:hypothetical protein